MDHAHSHLLFETWDSRWISSSLLLLTLTAYAATATTSCVSYGLVPWSGGIGAMVWRCILGLAPAYLRDLCHPTPEDAVHSDHPNRGYSLFLLLVHPQPRPVHSWWLIPLCGMGFRCRKDCSPGFFLTHSTLVSKLFFLAVQGSGALLSSNLEGALYKSP